MSGFCPVKLWSLLAHVGIASGSVDLTFVVANTEKFSAVDRSLCAFAAFEGQDNIPNRADLGG